MRPLRTWGILSASPVLQCPANRSALRVTQHGLRPQCFLFEAPLSKVTSHSARSFTLSAPSQSKPTPTLNPTFSYRIGASFSAKGHRFDPKENAFAFDARTSNTSAQDVVTGRPRSGQDAFFVSNVGNTNNVAFGVADGVGGWADQGIDSADLSHGLCQGMVKVAGELHSQEKQNLSPRSILGNAYREIVQERKIGGGGSTACVATGDEDGTLKVSK